MSVINRSLESAPEHHSKWCMCSQCWLKRLRADSKGQVKDPDKETGTNPRNEEFYNKYGV